MSRILFMKEARYKHMGDLIQLKGAIEVAEDGLTLRSNVRRLIGKSGGAKIMYKDIVDIKQKDKGLGPIKSEEIIIETDRNETWHIFVAGRETYPKILALRERFMEIEREGD